MTAHFVGSVPLENSEAVFRTLCGAVGGHVRRLPDGETGRRKDWIRHVQEMLTNHPQLEIDDSIPALQWVQWDGKLLREIPRLRFRAGVDPKTVAFETGYAADAIASYEVFERMQRDGAIPAGVKFEVCLPTPLAPGYNYVSPKALDDFLPMFEAAILLEVAEIAKAVPHERISIQWDVCQEVLMWENYYGEQPANFKEQILSELARVGAGIPSGVDFGYHLCYGSPRDEHLLQPKDMGVMVEMSNGILARAARTVDFLHLPVPVDRSDEAFFAPLADLELPDHTELLLGVVHNGDDEGNRARLAAARKFVRVDGIATECGWGRKEPERVPGLLAAHAALLS
jgi:hypothetical protein